MPIVQNLPTPSENESTPPLTKMQQLPLDVASGMVTGVTIAGGFHPWDRALYLSMANKRPFLYDIKSSTFVIENFAQPYHGFMQTVASRTISNGIYFVAQNQIKPSLYPYLRNDLGLYEWQAQFGVGLSVGSMTGMTTNGLYAVRFQTWGNPGSSFASSAYKMWSHGGVKPFIKGITATVARDATFGVIYEVLRNWGNDQDTQKNTHQFLRNASAAAVATGFSSPLNYVRNVQYATPPDQTPPKMMQALSDIWHESKSVEPLLSRLGFFHQRFKFGWGTARVAAGIAASQEIFTWAREKLSDASPDESPTPSNKK